MKNKLFLNLLSSGLQAMSVQVFGGVFFYLISIYTSKNDFGVIGWANAVSTFLVTLLSCGMEQVIVRRIASSKTSDWTAVAYFFHSTIGSVLMILVMCFMSFFLNDKSHIVWCLIFFFAAQSVSYIASPLRQYLNAKEKFTPYGVIAFISNLGKIALLLLVSIRWRVSVFSVAAILIVCALFELICLLIYILSVREFAFNFTFKFIAYKKLIKESIPQYLAVIFDSSLNRIDWILLGFLSTNIVTAEYSFAYRAYEIAKLPLLLLGPVILTKYSKILSNNGLLNERKSHETRRLMILEVFLSILILIALNILWSPIVGAITHGKYGLSNSLIFMIISLCLPFHFFINLLWTLCFATRRYKQISRVIMIIAIGNFAFNLFLIPFLGGLGAAISYLSAMILESIIFYKIVNKHIVKFSFMPIVILFTIGIISYVVGSTITSIFFVQLIAACIIYLTLSLVFKQVTKADLQIIKDYLKK